MRARSGRPLPVTAARTGTGAPSPGTDPRPLLYAVVCGSPAARHIGKLVALAQHAGWQVAVVATPSGRVFIDERALAAQTGYPVRSEYHQPGDPLRSRTGDAIVVAPATVNTVSKWANGIADTLALGLVVEAHGLGVPIVAMPFTNSAMAAHPAFRENLQRLRSWGVRVLFGGDVLVLPAPGTGADHAARFPWRLPLEALGPPRPALRAVPRVVHPPPGQSAGDRRGRPGRPAGGAPPRRVGGAAPPMAPRPAPAIIRDR
jgi:hypothetical protein